MKMKNYLLLHNLDFKAIPSRASTDADVINTKHLQQVRPSSQSPGNLPNNAHARFTVT
jgi:hypothetical protein